MAYVLRLQEEGLVYDHRLRLKESLTLFEICPPDIHSLILSHLELLRIDLPKLTSNILVAIVTIPVVLVDKFHFYMHQPVKTWLFEKISFELVYRCIFIWF